MLYLWTLHFWCSRKEEGSKLCIPVSTAPRNKLRFTICLGQYKVVDQPSPEAFQRSSLESKASVRTFVRSDSMSSISSISSISSVSSTLMKQRLGSSMFQRSLKNRKGKCQYPFLLFVHLKQGHHLAIR